MYVYLYKSLFCRDAYVEYYIHTMCTLLLQSSIINDALPGCMSRLLYQAKSLLIFHVFPSCNFLEKQNKNIYSFKKTGTFKSPKYHKKYNLGSSISYKSRFRLKYHASATTTRTTIEPAPQEKHANFFFLCHFWAKVSSKKGAWNNITRGLYWH